MQSFAIMGSMLWDVRVSIERRRDDVKDILSKNY